MINNGAGFALRAVGRLSEATGPMKAAVDNVKNLKDWENAASGASNLSELYLTIGEVAEAVNYGKQSVDYADRSGDDFEKESDRTTYADALFQSGERAQAEQGFKEAEQMQQKRQPEYPYLYSLLGFRYCDLLLSQGMLERAKTTLKWAKDNKLSLLTIALDKLTIGKALLLQSLAAIDHPLPTNGRDRLNWGDRGGSEAKDSPPNWRDRRGSEALTYLSQAVDGLRGAGQQQYLPLGLFTRASFYMHQQNFASAWADLDECREIAEYGQMKLHLADYHLEAGRVIREQLASPQAGQQSSVGSGQLASPEAGRQFEIIENGETLQLTRAEMQEKFREHVEAAEQLLNETGYHRRDEALEELRGEL